MRGRGRRRVLPDRRVPVHGGRWRKLAGGRGDGVVRLRQGENGARDGTDHLLEHVQRSGSRSGATIVRCTSRTASSGATRRSDRVTIETERQRVTHHRKQHPRQECAAQPCRLVRGLAGAIQPGDRGEESRGVKCADVGELAVGVSNLTPLLPLHRGEGESPSDQRKDELNVEDVRSLRDNAGDPL